MIKSLHSWTQHVVRARAWIRQHPRLSLTGLFVLIGLIAYTLLTRPGALFGPQDTTWMRSQINKDLYVGVDPSYPPFAEWTPEQIVGIEPDIAREIGRRFGVETQILIMGYDGLYDALFIGDLDMVIAGLVRDPGYTEWVHYSQPYFDAGHILVSPAANPVDQMRAMEGKTIAVEIATAGDQAAHNWQRRLRHLEIVRCLVPEDAMQAVQNGEADAALIDTVSARQYLAQHPDLVMAKKTTVPHEYVIAMRAANFRLAEEVENALNEMREDGTLDDIIARWLRE